MGKVLMKELQISFSSRAGAANKRDSWQTQEANNGQSQSITYAGRLENVFWQEERPRCSTRAHVVPEPSANLCGRFRLSAIDFREKRLVQPPVSEPTRDTRIPETGESILENN
jgi:hypothetical protein